MRPIFKQNIFFHGLINIPLQMTDFLSKRYPFTSLTRTLSGGPMILTAKPYLLAYIHARHSLCQTLIMLRGMTSLYTLVKPLFHV